MTKIQLNNKTHFLSVDLEDWHTSAYLRKYVSNQNVDYRIESTTNTILQMFGDHNVKATFFVLGSIAEKFPKLIKLIHQNNHEIASHGFSHTPLWNIQIEDFKTEIAQTNNILHSITGEKVIGFRAPYASLDTKTNWVIEILQSHGFKYDSSIFPLKTPLYGINNVPLEVYFLNKNNLKESDDDNDLIEIPFTIYKNSFLKIPCTGGIYGRFLPLPILRFLLKKIAEERPLNFYFHPWEIDKNIPILNVPLYNKFVSYHGINSYEYKIGEILKEFSFTSFRDKLELENII